MAPGEQQARRLFASRETITDLVPIILDQGDEAWVAEIRPTGDLFVGLRFEHNGIFWEIVHAGDHERGWVARPWLSS